MNDIRIGSLFSGIGGLELGLHWALGDRAETVFQVEREQWPREQVLAKHWPNADRSVTDVRDGNSATLAPVDVLTGGFPCQDISVAGKQEGFDGKKSALWFEMARIIRELRPSWVVLENVPAITSIHGGSVHGRVLKDLAEAGYDAEWHRIGANDVGLPHRRWRWFCICWLADTDSHSTSLRGERAPVPQASLGRGTLRGGCDGDAQRQESVRGTGQVEGVPVADTLRVRPQGQGEQDEPSSPAETPHREASFTFDDSKRKIWNAFARESWVANGISTQLGRHHNREALKAYGNAVVPMVAYHVGLRMIAIEEQLNNEQTLKEV